ncbi:hypothetical protein, partial [Thermococcus sp.]
MKSIWHVEESAWVDVGVLVLSMTAGAVNALQEKEMVLPKGATMIGKDLIVEKDKVPDKELFLKQLDAILKEQETKKTPIEPLGYHKEASASGYDSDTIFGDTLYLRSYLDVSWDKDHWWEDWRITVDPSPYAAHTAWLGTDPYYADSISLSSTVIFHGWVGSITVSADGPSWTISPDKREVTFSVSDE